MTREPASDGARLGPALATALSDARRAIFEYDDACAWFAVAAPRFEDPLAVEVWGLDPTLTHVLLVNHRWREWVPPGGAVEPGELPRDAAARELMEETGLDTPLLGRPAAVAVRSFHPDWPATLALSYVAIVERAVGVIAEPGQPASWKPLAHPWTSAFPDDRDRILAYVAWRADHDHTDLPGPAPRP